jgi:hypothetical protein
VSCAAGLRDGHWFAAGRLITGVIHLVDFDAEAPGSNRPLIQTVPREADTVATAVISVVHTTVLASLVLVQGAGVPGL